MKNIIIQEVLMDPQIGEKYASLQVLLKSQVVKAKPYYFALYSYSSNIYSERYVEDISVKIFNFWIGISKDRDEVYDKVNVIYQINGGWIYNLSDFELKTRIRDNNKIFSENNIKISSWFPQIQ